MLVPNVVFIYKFHCIGISDHLRIMTTLVSTLDGLKSLVPLYYIIEASLLIHCIRTYIYVLMYTMKSFIPFPLFQTSRKDLLMQDFEGVLKYFRVQLPRRYRSEDAAKELLNIAVCLKVFYNMRQHHNGFAT